MLLLLWTTVDLKENRIPLEQHLEKFPFPIQKKIKKLRRPHDRLASLYGLMLLAKGMKSHQKDVDWSDLTHNQFGKPYWKSNNVHFNISHAQEVVVCALQERSPIGIDIEQVRSIRIEDFKSQMTAKEWQRVQCSDHQERAFFNYWTQKEAVIKANGKGLSIGLRNWQLEDNLQSAKLEGQKWYIQPVSIHPEYCCHIATVQPIKEKINLIKVEF